MPQGKYGTFYTKHLEKCLLRKVPIVEGNYMLDPVNVGSGNNPFTLQSEYATVVLVKTCGYIFGRFCNNTGAKKNYKIGAENISGDHSEDFFMSTWEELWDEPVMEEIRLIQKLLKKPVYVTLKITKSPCDVCAEKLIKFIKQYDINLRLKILRLYSGGEGQL